MDSATAIQITQSLFIPNEFGPLSSVSVLGVGSDGMTTFLYIDSNPGDSGKRLFYWRCQGWIEVIQRSYLPMGISGRTLSMERFCPVICTPLVLEWWAALRYLWPQSQMELLVLASTREMEPSSPPSSWWWRAQYRESSCILLIFRLTFSCLYFTWLITTGCIHSHHW